MHFLLRRGLKSTGATERSLCISARSTKPLFQRTVSTSSRHGLLPNDLPMSFGTTDNYNQNSTMQVLAYRPMAPLFPDLSDRRSVTIADYGCSLGGNSIAPISALLQSLPDGAAATLVLNDVTSNDWNTASRVVMREGWDAVTRSGRLKVHMLLSPRSFYKQVVPDASVDIGVSWSAMHFLSQVPSLPPAALTRDDASLAALRAERTATQAHADLTAMLAARAAETRPGGYFFAAILASKSSSSIEVQTAGAFFYALHKALGRMMDTGRMTREQVLALEIPMAQRTESDIYAALEEVGREWALEGMFRGEVPHPAWLKIKALAPSETTESDRDQYAEEVVAWGMAVLTWQVVRALRVGSGEPMDAGSELSISGQEMDTLKELRREMKSVLSSECSEWPVAGEYLYVKLKRL